MDIPKAMTAADNRDRVQGRNVGVIGMARSGMACAILAHELGADVFVSDTRKQSDLSAEAETLKAANVKFETGGHTNVLLDSDYVIISPGISSKSAIVQKLQEAGTPIFSELEFASWFVEGKIIAVTGANGKTTTVTMIHEILRAGSYTSLLCGNIGTPLSSTVKDLNRDSVAVVEVSSYQLEFVDQFAPSVAAILNITPDHLSRHGTIENYRLAKLRISASQGKSQSLILNIDDSGVDALSIQSLARKVMFGSEETMNKASVESDLRGVFQRGDALYAPVNGANVKLIDTKQLQVPGQHNLENAMAAASCCLAFGVTLDTIRKGLIAFTGVEHRIEHVASVDGVKWINDSKATNLAATICALEALEAPVRLILGGQGKGENFNDLQDIVARKVKSIVAIGETKEEIFTALGKTVPVEFSASLEEATVRLSNASQAGEVVLLSPGCASFDMFTDFEERGAAFKNAVNSLVTNQSNGKGKSV